jgi:hypothetical protein
MKTEPYDLAAFGEYEQAVAAWTSHDSGEADVYYDPEDIADADDDELEF